MVPTRGGGGGGGAGGSSTRKGAAAVVGDVISAADKVGAGSAHGGVSLTPTTGTGTGTRTGTDTGTGTGTDTGTGPGIDHGTGTGTGNGPRANGGGGSGGGGVPSSGLPMRRAGFVGGSVTDSPGGGVGVATVPRTPSLHLPDEPDLTLHGTTLPLSHSQASVGCGKGGFGVSRSSSVLRSGGTDAAASHQTMQALISDDEGDDVRLA